MQRFVASAEEYFKLIPADQLPLLEHLQKLILQVVPKARAAISYGMLVYAVDKVDLFALAAQKHYVGLYVTPEAVKVMSAELADVDHGKCCLRFKRLDQVPTATIKKLLKLSQWLQKDAPPKGAIETKEKVAKKATKRSR